MVDAIILTLNTLEVLVALLLIGIILIQQGKSGGLGVMGGSVTETFLGASAGNVLTKATVILASIFLVITLLLQIISANRRVGASVGATEASEPPTPTMGAVATPAGDDAQTGGEADSTEPAEGDADQTDPAKDDADGAKEKADDVKADGAEEKADDVKADGAEEKADDVKADGAEEKADGAKADGDAATEPAE